LVHAVATIPAPLAVSSGYRLQLCLAEICRTVECMSGTGSLSSSRYGNCNLATRPNVECRRHVLETYEILNPLNAELNPICHLLVLLGNITFMGSCIVSIFQYTCISNKIQRYTVYLYLETAQHVSGGTSTHYQERIQLYIHHLVFVTPLLLSAAIVKELEPV
jgi:hypothetical protein